jgi:tRNA A37 threonylcarbamoyladenosine dehydratase
MISDPWQQRTTLMIGTEGLKKLSDSHVLIAGLGGVGSFAAEFLCRAGIGELTIVDSDKVNASNRNRQLIALRSTEGKDKTGVMCDRLMDINPNLKLNIFNTYLEKEETIRVTGAFDYDYVIDAIDTLGPKVNFIHECLKRNLKLVSSFGAGAKLDPSKIMVTDVAESYNCKLGYYLRKKLHKLNIYSGFKVVFSPEEYYGEMIISDQLNKKSIAGTISYMPAMFGGHCASVVIRELLGVKEQ